MSDIFFAELDIPAPKHHLGVGSGTHAEQTARMLERVEAVLVELSPAAVLVYGDTNSTLAAALAAAKLHIPVAHVEAGLRSFNRRMPEEINRVVADALSRWLFCPTTTAVDNLRKEGVTAGVHLVGDVMGDLLELLQGRLAAHDAIRNRFGVRAGAYAVATVHRAENTDNLARLGEILSGLGRLGIPVVFPMHPRTRGVIERHELGADLDGGTVITSEPLGYLDMLALVSTARCVITDSGGLQKEAVWLGVPCVTVRDETEWIETLEGGWNVLVGADAARLVSAAERERPETKPPAVFGGGHASRRIVEVLVRDLGRH
jgi:UDP-GlcNAc3NAcA epimerase